MQSHTTEYQKHLAIIKDLETTVRHQQTLLDQKAIPSSYHPRILKTSNTTLQEEFDKKYETLFMEHGASEQSPHQQHHQSTNA
jgi:hypothetical protein